MKNVLEIFTFQGGYKGGVATMIDAYMKGVDEFARNNYKLTHLNVAPTICTGNSKIDNIVYIYTQRKAVRQYLKEHKFDVANIHTSREYLFLKDVLLAKLISRKYKTPVVMTIHVGSIHTVYNRISWFKKRSIKLLNNCVSKVIFLSKTMCNDFIQEGLNEKRSTVLYNFHNFERTITDECTPHEQLRLLYVGAIHREKGIIELLVALSEMPELDYHLNICGKLTDESIKDEIEKYSKELGDKVSFLGYVSGSAKTELFKSSDLLILPSYHEGLPLVIMEALGAGCAIMATPVGSIPEILQNEHCLWVDVASAQSIKDQLTALTAVKLQQMRKANDALGVSFTFKRHVEELTKIYCNTIITNHK